MQSNKHTHERTARRPFCCACRLAQVKENVLDHYKAADVIGIDESQVLHGGRKLCEKSHDGS